MHEYDLLVVGGGSGTTVATAGAQQDLDVAVVEKGPLGGTCLTRGCDPSKALIHRADLVETIGRSEVFGVESDVTNVAFADIVNGINETFDRKAAEQERQIRDGENTTLYRGEAEFVDERTVEVDGDRLAAEKVVIAVGSRPRIPSSIDGLAERRSDGQKSHSEGVEYSTSADALRFDERPDHLVVVGGGYVAAELGHLYGSLGSELTIIGHGDLLLDREDEDVSRTVTNAFDRRYDVRTGYEATAVTEDDGEVTVRATDEDGDEISVVGDELLVAAGRKPNTNRLNVEAAGVETDEKGYVETDEYLQTTAENVWALGDVIGAEPFKHAANREAQYVVRNALGGAKQRVERPGMSHAVFTSPQVASTGKTESQLREDDREYTVGRAEYDDTALGMTLKADDGFVKVLADPGDSAVLGCHIVGPQASTLIHEVTAATAHGSGTVSDVTDTIHIHPALNEVLQNAFENVNA
jgi:dihydrolipoamide dehydrogenase